VDYRSFTDGFIGGGQSERQYHRRGDANALLYGARPVTIVVCCHIRVLFQSKNRLAVCGRRYFVPVVDAHIHDYQRH
jgi:hypothetical protein